MMEVTRMFLGIVSYLLLTMAPVIRTNYYIFAYKRNLTRPEVEKVQKNLPMNGNVVA